MPKERIAKKNHPKLRAEPSSYSFAVVKGRREGARGEVESSPSLEGGGSEKGSARASRTPGGLERGDKD